MFIQRLKKVTHAVVFLVLISAAGGLYATPQENKTSVDFAEILQFAKFSNAAYLPESTIIKENLPNNYSLTHYSKIPAIEIAYFLATDEMAKTHIISVRGTANIENAIVDIALKLNLDKHTGVLLHNGFSQAAQAIYKEIKPRLNDDYVISTTGHSLGGAVALILAMYLDVDHYKTGSIITFGQPKVTNLSGANKFQHLAVFRIVTPKDLVPLVPPLDPVDIYNINIYWHLGKEIVLLDSDAYAVLEGVSSMVRATRFTQETLNESNLKNHQMALYLDILSNKIMDARLVPFKHSFNLFNLFGGDEK